MGRHKKPPHPKTEEVRSLLHLPSIGEIVASIEGITYAQVYKIIKGNGWELENPQPVKRRNLDDEVKKYLHLGTTRAIAAQVGVSHEIVRRIVKANGWELAGRDTARLEAMAKAIDSHRHLRSYSAIAQATGIDRNRVAIICKENGWIPGYGGDVQP